MLLSSVAFDYRILPPKHHLLMEPSSYVRFAAFVGSILGDRVLDRGETAREEARREIDAKYRKVSADALAEARKSEARLHLIIRPSSRASFS